MVLCGQIVHGWLFCRESIDEDLFAQTLLEWPEGEQGEASKVIRRVLEFRFPTPLNGRDNPTPRFLRFLSGNQGEPGKETEILRTVAKAIGRYADLKDILRIGDGFSSQHASL